MASFGSRSAALPAQVRLNERDKVGETAPKIALKERNVYTICFQEEPNLFSVAAGVLFSQISFRRSRGRRFTRNFVTDTQTIRIFQIKIAGRGKLPTSNVSHF